MSSIGSVLKEARVKRSVSLEEVQLKTKIHPTVLQLLEEDKFDRLPSPLFVKSFLKTYAEFLEIKPDELIAAYEREKHRDPEQILFIRPTDPGSAQRIHPLVMVITALFVVLILLVLVGHPAPWGKFWPPHKIKISKPVLQVSTPLTVKKKAPVKVRPQDIKEVSVIARDEPKTVFPPPIKTTPTPPKKSTRNNWRSGI